MRSEKDASGRSDECLGHFSAFCGCFLHSLLASRLTFEPPTTAPSVPAALYGVAVRFSRLYTLQDRSVRGAQTSRRLTAWILDGGIALAYR